MLHNFNRLYRWKDYDYDVQMWRLIWEHPIKHPSHATASVSIHILSTKFIRERVIHVHGPIVQKMTTSLVDDHIPLVRFVKLPWNFAWEGDDFLQQLVTWSNQIWGFFEDLQQSCYMKGTHRKGSTISAARSLISLKINWLDHVTSCYKNLTHSHEKVHGPHQWNRPNETLYFHFFLCKKTLRCKSCSNFSA